MDADGYGDATATLVSCDAPSDFVADATDCDDADAMRFPGAEESCNTVDDDCDGTVDDGLDTATWYADADWGGGLAVIANTNQCSALLENVDVYANETDAPTSVGGGIYSGHACFLSLDNVSISANTSVDGGGVYVGGWSTEITFTNIHGNTSPEVSGIDDPIGTNGNIAADPGYADVSASDPTAWDLMLAAGSALIDAGDTGLLDPDGSRSDIGAYGGAAAAYW